MAGGTRSRKVLAEDRDATTPAEKKQSKKAGAKLEELETSLTVDSKRPQGKVLKSRISSCFTKSEPQETPARARTTISACFKSSSVPKVIGEDLPPGFRTSQKDGLSELAAENGTASGLPSSCLKEREALQNIVAEASKGVSIKTRLNDEEREECRRLKKCYTCGESGHPYFKCPQEENRLNAIQAEKESKLNSKLWREPCWMYKSANGQSQGPYTLDRLATKLQDGVFSGLCEVTHLHKKVGAMTLRKLMDFADSGTLSNLLHNNADAAIKKGIEVSGILHAVQTKLHAEVVQTTGRFIFNDAIDERLQQWLVKSSNASKQDFEENVLPYSECHTGLEAEPPPPGCEIAASFPALLRESGLSSEKVVTPLENVQRTLHSAVLEAARRSILDAVVGQYLQSWMMKKESEKKAIGDDKMTAYQNVDISSLECSDIGTEVLETDALQSMDVDAGSKKEELEAIELFGKRVKHTKRKSAAVDNEPRKKKQQSRKRLVKLGDAEATPQECHELPKPSPEKFSNTEVREKSLLEEEEEALEEKVETKQKTGKRKSKRRNNDDNEDYQPSKLSKKRLTVTEQCVVDVSEADATVRESTSLEEPLDEHFRPVGESHDDQQQMKEAGDEQVRRRNKDGKRDYQAKKKLAEHLVKSERIEERSIKEENREEDSTEQGKEGNAGQLQEETVAKKMGGTHSEDESLSLEADLYPEVPAPGAGGSQYASCTRKDDQDVDGSPQRPKKLQSFTRRKQAKKLQVKARSPAKSETSPRQRQETTKRPLVPFPPDANGCSRCYINGWEWREWSRGVRRSGFVLNQHRERDRENILDDGSTRLRYARKNRMQLRKVAAELKVCHLQARKKRLKFQRSKIHAWGLVAIERIEPEDFVIEYVGEVVRSKIADLRERRYETNGMDSSYLFRIDGDNVVDATKHGGLARFINHSCDPNCYTKILTMDGRKRIFIYSKKTIEKGEELTYDYKFPLEEQKIPCFCGAARCRRFMN